MTPAVNELLRQIMRWLGVYLMTLGLPQGMADMFADPAFVDAVSGFVGFASYAAADFLWGASKVKA